MPKLLIFDLDQTLWAFDAAQPRFQTPHRLAPEGVQCQAAVAKPFKEAAEIVRHLKGSGQRLAVASANSQEKVCASLLQHMGFLQDRAGFGGIEKSIMAIYPGSKTAHFKQIADGSGLEFREMLFFDDRALNVRAAQKLGIVAHQVSSLDGLTWKDFSAGLDAWRAQRRSSLAMSKWLRPKVTTPAGLESAAEAPPVVGISRYLRSATSVYSCMSDMSQHYRSASRPG